MAPYTQLLGAIVLTTVTLLAGCLYLTAQWWATSTVRDVPFVSMLVAATAMLVLGMRRIALYIRQKGPVLYTSVMPKDDPEQGYREYHRLCGSMTGFMRMTAAGILYGAAIGSAPIVLTVWEGHIWLRTGLALFMFTVNFVTGVAFFALIRFLVASARLGATVDVKLWDSRNPSVDFLLGAARRVSLLAAAYIAICISSILFSVLPLRGLVIAYSAFAGGVLFASVAVPIIPIARRRAGAKAAALTHIDQRVQDEFQTVIKRAQASDDALDLATLEGLLQLRDKILGCETWPFRLASIATAASVLSVSCVPVLLQVVLERCFD